MLIRKLNAADAAAFKDLRTKAVASSPESFTYTAAEVGDLSSETMSNLVQPTEDQAIFGAFEGDLLVGVVGIRREPMTKVRHKVNVSGVYTREEYRQRGISRQLINLVIVEAKTRFGATTMTLAVNVENNNAKRLYQSFGFSVYGTNPRSLLVNGRYVTEDLIIKYLPN